VSTTAWAVDMLDELAAQIAAHPLLDALVQARVSEALAERGGDRKWYTTEEAGKRLGCSPDAVRMRVKRGRLDGKHQGRRLYVSAASVDLLEHAA
jgi:hypothetical protein